jgi:hypothetical protein
MQNTILISKLILIIYERKCPCCSIYVNFGLDYAQSQTIAKPNNLKGFGSKKTKYKIAKIS